MKKLTTNEMRNTNGGFTASATCSYCGTTYKKKWYEAFSWCYANGWVLSQKRACEISCAAAQCGI